MPEPILISIAAEAAGKASPDLYRMVERKFSTDPRAVEDLAAAVANPDDPDAVEAVAERLSTAEKSDPEFKSELRAAWGEVTMTEHAEDGGVTNRMTE
jgi:hypothetical protein